ncbi:hypothetical protein FQR65_LT18033 [Abscondita terminalis]|nr:hypothetical protein FQR65_LT18033 [Abscondita terminalis]
MPIDWQNWMPPEWRHLDGRLLYCVLCNQSCPYLSLAEGYFEHLVAEDIRSTSRQACFQKKIKKKYRKHKGYLIISRLDSKISSHSGQNKYICGMNILIIGSGGRESAFAYKIAQSKKLDKLFIAPGNAGTLAYGENVPLKVTDFEGQAQFALDIRVDADMRGYKAYPCYRSSAGGSPVGGVKKISQNSLCNAIRFMGPYSASFHLPVYLERLAYLKHRIFDCTKGGWSAAGKGVLICESLQEAKDELKAMIADAKFGAASDVVVVEEFLKE